MPFIDITGQRFGRWTVLARAENSRQKQARWLCRCDCGTERVVSSILVRRAGQPSSSSSCGCLKRELIRARATRHGHTSNGRVSPTHSTWHAMLQRCTNPNNDRFHDYGGRGITVCERWLVFENFLADMGEKPPRTSLGREDNDLGYTPENCYWATAKEQARNTSRNRFITLNGVTLTISAWSEKLGIPQATISGRLRNGWSDADAISTTRMYHKNK